MAHEPLFSGPFGASREVFRRRIFRSLAGLATVFLALRASAEPLLAEPFLGQKIRIDGDLREWSKAMSPLSVNLRGTGLSAHASIGYDDNNLYLAVRVNDRRIARTPAAGPQEDHARLLLAFPEGGRYVTHEVDVYPGRPGKLPAVVRINRRTVAGTRAVERVSQTEVELEAQVPWAAFPQARRTRIGLRAAVRYSDADQPGAVRRVVATSSETTGQGLGALLLQAEQGLLPLLRNQGISDRPSREVYADLSGDAMLERAAIFGRFLTISGPHFRKGKEIFFAELGVASAKQVRRLSVADLDSDGHADVVIEKRVGSADKYRGVLQIFKVGTDDQPEQVFVHEIAIKTPEGLIENQVLLGNGSIEIAQGKAQGFEPGAYSEARPSNMPSALLPWEAVASRRYRWGRDRFIASHGKEADPSSPRPRTSGNGGRPAASATSPLPARIPASEQLDRVYALYRSDRGAKTGKPRFDLAADLAEDPTLERLVIHDTDVVIFGSGFQKGTSYTFLTVPVRDSKDILDASTRDVTGDGKAEVILRAVLRTEVSEALGGGTVERHAFLVYSVQAGRLVRIFGAETARVQGKNRIDCTLHFSKGARGELVSIAPGKATGWTEANYPFPEDVSASEGLEPLVLPWSARMRTYQFDGRSFVVR